MHDRIVRISLESARRIARGVVGAMAVLSPLGMAVKELPAASHHVRLLAGSSTSGADLMDPVMSTARGRDGRTGHKHRR